jgi:methyl coenzyme M reductase gamma subunit
MFDVTFKNGDIRRVKHEGTAVMLANAEPGSRYMPVFNPYDEMNKKELQAEAATRNIVGRSKMTKDQLLTAIKEA